MRARCLELVDKSIAAMIAAIEIYNKPDFRYREETYSVLNINAWELLIKAYWLKQHSNKVKKAYMFTRRLSKKMELRASKLELSTREVATHLLIVLNTSARNYYPKVCWIKQLGKIFSLLLRFVIMLSIITIGTFCSLKDYRKLSLHRPKTMLQQSETGSTQI